MKRFLWLLPYLLLTLSIFSAIKYELPEIKPGETIINHTYYTIDYNKESNDPIWSAEELTHDMTQGSATRPGKFKKDPLLPGSFGHEEYTGTGYDRGHQVPAADMKFDQTAMNETFYTTNICPQYPQLNQQDWEKLEELVRAWTNNYSRLYIVTGPIFTGTTHKTIGKTVKIAVPEKFFKAILVYYPEKPEDSKAIAFIMENKKPDTGKATEDYAVPVSQVEKETGIKFFAAVQEPLRTNIINKLDKASWNWGLSKLYPVNNTHEQVN